MLKQVTELEEENKELRNRSETFPFNSPEDMLKIVGSSLDSSDLNRDVIGCFVETQERKIIGCSGKVYEGADQIINNLYGNGYGLMIYSDKSEPRFYHVENISYSYDSEKMILRLNNRVYLLSEPMTDSNRSYQLTYAVEGHLNTVFHVTWTGLSHFAFDPGDGC